MSFWEGDVLLLEDRFEVFLGALLGMKSDNIMYPLLPGSQEQFRGEIICVGLGDPLPD